MIGTTYSAIQNIKQQGAENPIILAIVFIILCTAFVWIFIEAGAEWIYKKINERKRR